MPAPRKPKKVFIQFGIALVIAIILFIGALGIGFTVIMGVNTQATKAQDAVKKKEEELAAQQEALNKKEEALKQQQTTTPTSFNTVQAIAEIKQGQPITKEMITLVETKNRPSPGILTELSQAVGKISKVNMFEGETLDMNKVLDSSGMLNVNNGMRAISLKLDGPAGLNGSLMPGMHVDVLATIKNKDGNNFVTRTLLQNVEVLSTGGPNPFETAVPQGRGMAAAPAGAAAAPSTSPAGSITLAVTPKQAEMLSLMAGAEDWVHVYLTLRSYNDKQLVDKLPGAEIASVMTGISADMLDKKLPPPPPSGSPAADGFKNINLEGKLPNGSESPAVSGDKWIMTIYKGASAETREFEPGN